MEDIEIKAAKQLLEGNWTRVNVELCANAVLRADYSGALVEKDEWEKSKICEWISVDDRLPDMAYNDGVPVYYLCKSKELSGMFVGFAISKGGAYQIDHEEGIRRSVSHWMPLPVTPEEGEGKCIQPKEQ